MAEVAGKLVIASRVGSTIAEQAALGVPGVVAYRNSLGSLVGDTPKIGAKIGNVLPHADFDLNSPTPRVAIKVALAWPSAVTQVCRDLRAHLTEELVRLTGVRPVAVDVEVTQLVPQATDQGTSA